MLIFDPTSFSHFAVEDPLHGAFVDGGWLLSPKGIANTAAYVAGP